MRDNEHEVEPTEAPPDPSAEGVALLTAGVSTTDLLAESDAIREIPYRLRELIAVLVSVGAGAAVLILSRFVQAPQGGPLGPPFWPTMIGWAMVGFGLLLVFVNVIRGKRPVEGPDQMTRWGVGRLILAAVLVVLYLLLWNLLQFWVSTLIVAVALTFLFGGRTWKALIVFPAVITAVLHFLFIVALRVPL